MTQEQQSLEVLDALAPEVCRFPLWAECPHCSIGCERFIGYALMACSHCAPHRFHRHGQFYVVLPADTQKVSAGSLCVVRANVWSAGEPHSTWFLGGSCVYRRLD